MIPEELRGRVCFHSGDSLTLLPTLLRKIGPIDFFIHDSHHTYAHMMAEYELALQHLQPGGVISSHDVLYCNAWQHFIRKHGISRAQAVRNLALLKFMWVILPSLTLGGGSSMLVSQSMITPMSADAEWRQSLRIRPPAFRLENHACAP